MKTLFAAIAVGTMVFAFNCRDSAGAEKTLTLAVTPRVKMKLALIPAGKFTIGSPAEEKDLGDNQTQHEVTISKPFYMGVFEVTQAEYRAVMGKNPSAFKGAKNPVETVSWDDAVSFCKKLSEKTGKTVRLPTEAEWEYACRAGTTTRFSFGDDEQRLGEYAWYGTNWGDKTHPVGQKKPNRWGLYDMHGNVWEWVADWYGGYEKGAATDPTGPATGQWRVLRGGSWHDLATSCRSAYRFSGAPGLRDCGVGFRVVCVAGVD